MNLHAEFYPLAVEMLEEFGGDATLVSTAPAPAAFNKQTGRPVTGAPAPQNRPVRVAVGPIDIAGVDGRLTYRTAATMLVEPREGDKLVQGDLTWIIGKVTRIAPQGQSILFIAEVSS